MELTNAKRGAATISADLQDFRDDYAMELDWAQVTDDVDEAIMLLTSVYQSLRY